MREASPTDFAVSVEGIGDFVFAKRTMRDQFKIDAEIVRLTDGLITMPQYLLTFADAMACVKVLTVTAPAGWDIEKLDPLEEDSYSKVIAVHAALRDQENTFRGKPRETG